MYGTKWMNTFLSLTKFGLINEINVKVNRSACDEDIRMLINVKCSLELSARLKTRTAIVKKLIAKYAPDSTLRDIR
jgi:hypothetical protein